MAENVVPAGENPYRGASIDAADDDERWDAIKGTGWDEGVAWCVKRLREPRDSADVNLCLHIAADLLEREAGS